MQDSPFSFSIFATDSAKVAAALLAGIGFFVRWVLAPAAMNYTRKSLEPELEQVTKIPLLESRVDRLEGTIEKLAAVPEQLGRIEGYLKGQAE